MATVKFNIADQMNVFTADVSGGGGSTDLAFMDFVADNKNSIGYLGDFKRTQTGGLNGHIDKVFLSSTVGAIPHIEITDIAVSLDDNLYSQYFGGRFLTQISILLSKNDILTGSSGNDAILGFDGNDTLIGGAGADVLDGGMGSNIASYATAKAGVFAGLEDTNANTGDAAGDTYANIQNLTGSKYNDILYGTNDDNRFSGGAGNDLMVGKGGADRFNGGSGSDTVGYDADYTGLTVDLMDPWRNTGTATGDTYVSIENLDGSSNDDILYGDNKANIISSNVYHDTASGNDRLYGRGGDDKLQGFDGNDTLVGGTGIDRLYGGTGADIFVFATGDSGKTTASTDTIYDFTSADRINLTGWDANATKAGVQDFDFIGTKAFDGHAGELRYVKAASDTWIQGDTNGDKKIDLIIHLDDAVDLAAGYFQL